MSSFSGVVKVKHLSCVCLGTNDVVVVNSECILFIIQNGNEVWSYKLSRGIRLLVPNGRVVNIDEILCFDYIKANSLVSLVHGLTMFKNLMYYLNLKIKEPMTRLVELWLMLYQMLVTTRCCCFVEMLIEISNYIMS